MNAAQQSIEKARPESATPTRIGPAASRPRRFYSPSVDVVERPDSYVLTVDLPGVSEGDLDISVERNVLTLIARREPRTYDDHSRLLGEVAHGDYRRTFTLPEQVNGAGITAALRNGVLTLTVPKAEASLPRKIPIQTP